MKLLLNSKSNHKIFCSVIFLYSVQLSVVAMELPDCEYPLDSLFALTDYNEQENSLFANDSLLADLNAINARLATVPTQAARASVSENNENKKASAKRKENSNRCPWKGCHRIIRGNMKRHLCTHTGVIVYRCSKCKEGFNQPGNGHRHVNIHHHNSKGAGIINLQTGNHLLTKFISFKCVHCKREPFLDKYSYQRHLKAWHNKKLINRHYAKSSIKSKADTEESESEEAMSDFYSDDSSENNEAKIPMPALYSAILAFNQKCFDFEITAIKCLNVLENRITLINKGITRLQQQVSIKAVLNSLVWSEALEK